MSVCVSLAAAQPAPSISPAPVERVEPPAPVERVDEYPFAPGDAYIRSDRSLDHEKSRFRLGKGLALESEDGDFALITRLRAQFLYQVESADIENADGEIVREDATQSFQIRRARLQFGGHVWDEDIQFKAELAFSEGDLGVRDTSAGTAPRTSPLLDWYLDFTHLRDLNVRVGQSKLPFNRQRVISSGDLQLVDRSIVNSEFNVDRDLGVDIRSEDFLGLDLLRYYLGVYAGHGRNSNQMSDFNMLYLGRAEVLPMGDFADYKEGDLYRNQTPKLSLGVAAGYYSESPYSRGTRGAAPADGGTTDFRYLNADAVLMYSGFSFFSEFILRDGSRNPGDAEDEAGDPIPVEAPSDGFGIMGQVGYLIPTTRLEVAGRVGANRPLGDNSGLGDENEFGIGVNYYFALHALKLQADYFHLTETPAGASGDEQLASDQFRLQLQAGF